jgi:hypothetical protein
MSSLIDMNEINDFNPVSYLIWYGLASLIVLPVSGYLFGLGLWAAMPQKLRNAVLSRDETLD